MKLNFKKISAVLGSFVMTGATLGFAAAAAYPAPFVQSGTANVAIVYGTGQGVSSLDMVQAQNIQNSLATYVTGGSTSVDGGESFMLDKSSNHFNFANALNAVYATLDEDQMDFLDKGTYDDGSVDETFEQKITLSTKALTLFSDTDYNSKEPTVGFHWTNGQSILEYEFNLDDDVNYTLMVGTDMPLLGNSYYVLAASATQIDILDTANSQVMNEGETVTVELDGTSYTVSVAVYSDSTGSYARFIVNGETAEKLYAGQFDEISNDVYIVAKSVDYVSKDTGTSQVEFSLGKGKIELIDGEEAELNNEDIDGLNVIITDGSSTSFLDTLTLNWTSDKDTFLTEEDSIAMPGFGVIQLVFGGLETPADSEMISLANGDTLTLEMESYDLPLIHYETGALASTTLGEEDNLLKAAADSYTYTELGFNNNTFVWWKGLTNATANVTVLGGQQTVVSASAINLSETNRFIATRITTELSDVETLYYELNNIDIDDQDTFTVQLDDQLGNNDLVFESIGDTDDAGDVTVTLVGFSSDNLSAIFTFAAGADTITYNKAVSEKGLVVTFPTSATDAVNDVGALINFTEMDKDDDLSEGYMFTATVKNTSNNRLHVSTHNLTAYDEEESDEHYIGYVPSDLASKLTFDTNADEYEFEVEYFGQEVTADVQVVAGGEVSSTSGLGNVLVMDSEVSSVSSKNLVIVGGSCINSAAATALGVSEHTCGAQFTSATGVSAGQFLIKGVQDAFSTGKLALVVAGYETADTQNAATYLVNRDVDTASSYKGTSATSAELVVE